ncbi:hypothetical protein [Nocardia brasiliensis]|uniref:hypothetical protein n=1 Tax=Nocardia brasiliensis TaxID=37326 RepID=UPI0024571686|nr:hypothetical protein [Nocardia brasiliensis]
MSAHRHIQRVQKGCGPVFALCALLGGTFFYLVAWCTAGWPGVIGLAVVSALFGLVVRSERAHFQRVRDRAEAELIARAAEAAVTSPRRSGRRNSRGGVR